MTRLAGEWAEPTIDGPRTIILNGRPFAIPRAVEVKIVTAAGSIEIAHVRFSVDGVKRVAVLSPSGQLQESDAHAVLRAGSTHWNAIEHDSRR